MQAYITAIHTWGAQNWWHAMIVNGVGALLGVVLAVWGIKYLPAPVVDDITAALSNTHVVSVGVSDTVIVSGTVVQ